jgi:choice-of-anchor C domain-containing protein
MGAPSMTPSPYGARPSAVAMRPFSGSPHCPKYRKGTGILADGDFHDSADAGGGYFTFNKGQKLAPDWTVTLLDINLVGTTFWNFDHLCSVDLDGESAVGGIAHRPFPTQKGAAYKLTFLLSGNDYCGPNIKKMNVSVGNQSAVFKWNDSNGHSVENGKFAQRYLNFTAVSSTSTLKFTSLDTAGSGCGPVIGAIAVTKV